MCNGSNTTLTKYNNNSSYGTVDSASTLETSDDAASATQSTCRMPTKSDVVELYSNTTSAWTSDYNGSGVSGMIFTSTKEGYTDKSIFVPAAGHCFNGSLRNIGSLGCYWSCSLDESDSRVAWNLYFNSSNVSLLYENRYFGRSVRAVLV